MTVFHFTEHKLFIHTLVCKNAEQLLSLIIKHVLYDCEKKNEF